MKPADMPLLESYKRTPNFTENSVPAGLLADHSTKEGVWGLIHVTQGRLRYFITDPRREPEEYVLHPGTEPGVVESTKGLFLKIRPVKFQLRLGINGSQYPLENLIGDRFSIFYFYFG